MHCPSTSSYLLLLLAIFSTGSKARPESHCNPPSPGRPRLSYSAYRLAASEFLQHYPERSSPQQYIFTHWNREPETHIKCPTVIENQGCVFTLHCEYDLPFYQLTSTSPPFTRAALRLARECVGERDVDVGNITWTGFGHGGMGTIWIRLSHGVMRQSGLYANITNSGDVNGPIYMG